VQHKCSLLSDCVSVNIMLAGSTSLGLSSIVHSLKALQKLINTSKNSKFCYKSCFERTLYCTSEVSDNKLA